MTQEIKLGLVGYGSNTEGKGHYTAVGRGQALLQLATGGIEGVKAAGICDSNPRALEIAHKDFPLARVFTDFDAMLNEVPMDALLIETPAYLHTGFAVKALARNIHVLSDIPCVATLEEAWLLWAAQQKSKAFYMAGANPNMAGWIETALDLKKRGLLGDPYYIEAEYIHDCREYWEITPWRKPDAKNPRFPIKYCTHSLGPVLRLIDEDLEWVSCFDTGSHINKAEGQHDAMTALLRTKGNVVVRLLTSFINNVPGGCQHNYRFFTTKGAFERTPPLPTFQSSAHAEQGRTLFYSTELYGYKNWIELPIDAYSRPENAHKKESGHGGVDYALLDAFIAAVRAGGPSPINLREGLRMTLPGIYAAASAVAGGQLLHMEYPWTAAQPPTLPKPV